MENKTGKNSCNRQKFSLHFQCCGVNFERLWFFFGILKAIIGHEQR
jgi:hypothetical protein